MVTLNSQIHRIEISLNFKHFVDVPGNCCSVATARDQENRIHLFLIEQSSGEVYWRNGLEESWKPERRGKFRDCVVQAYCNRKVPHFTSDNDYALTIHRN